MNCREAQDHLLSERDHTLDGRVRVALDRHVGECAKCRQVRDELASAIAVWRTDAARVVVPDAEREWHAVRRRIRGGATEPSASRQRRGLLTWIAVPVGAAAAIALGLFVTREQAPGASFTSAPRIARADYVEAPGRDASIVISMDEQTGALFVVASDVPHSGD